MVELQCLMLSDPLSHLLLYLGRQSLIPYALRKKTGDHLVSLSEKGLTGQSCMPAWVLS